jgi:hypothetical protein
MKSADVFPSKWLKAEDLGDKEPTVTIDRVVLEDLGDGQKPVAYFRGKEKGLVLNKTNWSMLEHLCRSDESDEWTGQQIRLSVEMVPFQGKIVPSIRVKRVIPSNGPRKVEIEDKGSYKLSSTTETHDPVFDDEIPFK